MAEKLINKDRDLKSCFLIPVYVFLLIIFLGFIVSGCSPMERHAKIQPETKDLEPEENAFPQNDSKAVEIIDKDTDLERIDLALYNLACSKLARSETEQELIEAMALLKEWRQSKQAGYQGENPIHLIPGLEKTIELKEKERWESLKKNEQMVAIVKDQERTIVKLEQMIKTLKHQISELENIDQEIQEKRKNN